MSNSCDVCAESVDYYSLYHPGHIYASPYMSLSRMVAVSRPVAPVSIHLCKSCFDETVEDDDKDADYSKVIVLLSMQIRFKLSDIQVCQFMFEDEIRHFFTLKEGQDEQQ